MSPVVALLHKVSGRLAAVPTHLRRGATATEYAVVVGLIVVALIAIGTVFNDVLLQLWCGMVNTIGDVPGFSITPPEACVSSAPAE
jgi:Flp pilus assembly pilin Flp